MKLLKIKPFDNTFFRKGNNFDMEVSNVIQTKNIAYPSTFFGAVFTAILANNDNFREKFLTKENNTDHFKILNIKQIYLYDEKQGMVYIPAPKDLFVGYKDVKIGEFKELKGEGSISYPYYLGEPDGDELERADDYYVSIKDFYLKYKYKVIEKTNLKHKDDIFIKNSKTGIALDKGTSTVKESCLYTIEQTEFKNLKDNYWSNDWSFVVEYTINNDFVKENYYLEINDLDKGQLKLGGESKVCSYEVIENEYINEFRTIKRDEILKPREKLKVIFTSDSYFKEDFKDIFNDGMEIQALVNDKPIYIGGFDVAKNEEKAMFKGYLAGTLILLKNVSNKNIGIQKYLDEKLKSELNNGFNQYIYVKGE